MTNNQIMKKYLQVNVIQPLLAQGFTGEYPHFRQEKEKCSAIEREVSYERKGTRPDIS